MNDLVEACLKGDAEKFKQLFSEAENHAKLLEKQDKGGRRLVHHAAEGGSKEIVTIILDKGGPQQVVMETYPERDTPLNVALMSGKPSSVEISSLFLERFRELNVRPRKNQQGNYPLHYACKVGNLEFIQALVDAFPTTSFEKNRKGNTPLSFAAWEGNVKAVKILLGHASSNLTKDFKDFTALFPSYSAKEGQLDHPINVFVMGENQSGKSSLIKSVQAEGGAERFWGVTYNTTNVDVHKIGLIPTDFLSKHSGRIVFQDLASGPKYLNVQLVNTPEEVEQSLFFVIVDCRPDRREMERKLEFWLSVVHKQCANAIAHNLSTSDTPSSTTPSPHGTRILPNVVVIGSYGDYTRVFRNVNDIRIDQVFRSVTKKNPRLMSGLNIIDKMALDCRKAQSVQMARIRSVLKSHYRRRRPSLESLSHECYILSSILAEKAMEDITPVISLEDLSQEIREKPSNEALTLYSLLPSDIPQLLEICKALERRKRILLVQSDPYTYDEDITIVYDLQKLAGLIDTTLLEMKPLPDQPPNPKVALIEREMLQEELQQELSVRANVIIPVLDALKIHSLSVQEDMDILSLDCPHYFIPSLLPETNPDLEEWDEGTLCFAWTYRPAANQLYSHFLPTFTNSLLLVLFDLCASMDSIAFDYRTLWQGGISFRQGSELEVAVIIASTAITLNLRYNQTSEIVCLHLRNRLLEKIHLLKKTFQPEMETVESVIPRDMTKFPVRSPSPTRNQLSVSELRQNITAGSLSVAGSILSLPQSQASQLTTSSLELNYPFFEHCFYLPQLNSVYCQYLMLREHKDTEITDDFLYALRRSVGESYYNMMEQYFNLPPITITPASSVCGPRPLSPVRQKEPVERHHMRSGSVNFRCNTYGNLVQCLDSISIFRTAEFLAENQYAKIFGSTTLTQESSSVSIHSSSLTPVPPRIPQRLFPHTTRSTDGYSNIYFVDQLQVFTLTSDGGVFHSPPHGITVTFPSGAVPESSPPVTVEFGVALNGPFEFPPDVKPVSPFMWLCTDTPGFVFQKPVEVVIPHFMSLSSSDSEHLSFMKANHREVGDEYAFKECTEKMKFKARSNHGVLLTTHTCFLCIVWKLPENVISRANYCLMKVTPKATEKDFDIFFCFTFFLETCMEVVQRQFTSDNYQIQRSLVSMDKSLSEPQLSINFDQEPLHGWKVTKNGGETVIPASDVEFWHKDIGQLQMMNSYNMYPPRFALQVSGAEASKNSIMEVRFGGLKQPIEFQIQLKLPLEKIDSGTSLSVDKPGLQSIHVLDRIIVQLEQYLEIDTIRLRLRQSGVLTSEDMQTLLDVSLKKFPQSVKVEILVDVIKKKGDSGLRAFVNALEETTDGTGHQSILDIIRPLL